MLAKRATMLAVGLVVLTGCGPSEPVGPVHAERLSAGRYEVAQSLCPKERIIKVDVFDSGSPGFDLLEPDPEALLWSADSNGRSADRRVVVLGDDGSFGFEPSVPLQEPLSDKLYVVATTTNRTLSSLVNRSDFRREKGDQWWRAGKRVPISDVIDKSCPK